MPGRTARTTVDRVITKDLQAAVVTRMTTQGEGLGHLLDEVLCITIGIAIEIKIEMEAVAGTEIAIGNAPDGQTGAGDKCQVMKAKEAMQTRRAHRL